MGRTKRFMVSLSFLIPFLASLLLSEFSAFRYLGVPVMNPTFADLRLITSASDCLQNSAWSMNSVSCDPWERPFNYPSLWVHIFSFMHIGESQTQSLGIIEIFLLVASFAYWFWRVSTFFSIRRIVNLLFVYLIFVFSPPILLLAERGNVDILIFSGITIATEILRRKAFMFSGFLLVVLGTLKIYPFAGILIPFLAVSSRLKRSLFILLAATGVLLISGEIRLISDRSVTSWNSISYGLNIIPLILCQKLHIDLSREAATFIGIVSMLCVGLALWKLFRNGIQTIANKIASTDDFNFSFQMFSLIVLLSYLVGTSYDYRLVISMPLFMILFSLQSGRGGKSLVLITLISILYGGHLLSRLGTLGLLLNTLSDAIILAAVTFISLILVQLNQSRVPVRK